MYINYIHVRYTVIVATNSNIWSAKRNTGQTALYRFYVMPA
jgi:hypothetical protein